MKVRKSCIPGHEDTPVEAHVFETVPERVRLALSADEFGITRGPLRRGQGPPFIVRHEGGKAVRVTSQEEMRRDLRPVVGPPSTHLSMFGLLHPERTPLAVTGCGNLGLNPGVQAVDSGGRLGAKGPLEGVIEVYEDGSGRRIVELPDKAANFALSGPDLVREGRTCRIEASAFADPRHLLLFPYVEIRPDLWVDFGHDVLLNNKKVPLYQRAVDGEAITLSLMMRLPGDDAVDAESEEMMVTPDALRSALAVKGYDLTLENDDSIIQMQYLPGIYPHHVLAVRESGAVCSVVISGSSNRAGVTIRDLAEDLVDEGFTDAILLDNGGDVGLYLPQENRFVVRPAEKDRKERWPLTACLVFWEEC